MTTEQQKNLSVVLNGTRYLCFSLGEEDYAIPLLTVKEVIAVPDTTKIPNTPSYFLGIMNLRGQVISVIDLRSKFSVKPKAGSETSVIICELYPLCIGVVVDAINYVFSPTAEEVSDKPEMHGSKTADAITGVYRREKNLVLFVDIAKALNVEDYAAVKQVPAKKAA